MFLKKINATAIIVTKSVTILYREREIKGNLESGNIASVDFYTVGSMFMFYFCCSKQPTEDDMPNNFRGAIE